MNASKINCLAVDQIGHRVRFVGSMWRRKTCSRRNSGCRRTFFDAFPKGETFIQAGPVLHPEDALEAPWPRESTHKFRLLRDNRGKVAEFGPGDAAYIPMGFGHAIRNTGAIEIARRCAKVL
jgi:hypothetical protein